MKSLSIDNIFKFNKVDNEDSYIFKKLVKEAKIENGRILKLNIMRSLPSGQYGLKQLMDGYIDNINASPNFIFIIETYKLYHNHNWRNFVVSKPLLEALSKTKIDLLSEDIDLPIGTGFNFEIDGFYGIEHVIGYISNNSQTGIREINFVSKKKSKGGDFGVATIPLIPGKTIDQWIVANDTGNYRDNIGFTKNSTRDLYRLICNLILYITGPNEDFIEQVNTFSKSTKARKKEELSYTIKPFTTLGENVQFLRLVKETDVEVCGHWKTVHCDKGRTGRKYIFINGYIRTQTRFMINEKTDAEGIVI